MLIITEALIITLLGKRKEQPMKYDWLGRPIKRTTRRQADTARRNPVAKNKSRTAKRARKRKSKK